MGHWLSPGRDTVGALDFGGASTKITFETTDVVEDKSNVMELRLYGRDYHPYTQSFLCYGRDQVLRRLLAHLVKVTHVLLKHSSITNTELLSTSQTKVHNDCKNIDQC